LSAVAAFLPRLKREEYYPSPTDCQEEDNDSNDSLNLERQL